MKPHKMTNDSWLTGFNCGLPYQVTHQSRSIWHKNDQETRRKHQSADYATSEAAQISREAVVVVELGREWTIEALNGIEKEEKKKTYKKHVNVKPSRELVIIADVVG